MKTKSIAQAGMLCAVYGVMIFMNTLTGLWVESIFPYLFCFPILICALQNDVKVSFCAMAAMFILTLMLSSLTTWLIAGSMLLAGWIFGSCIHKRISILTASMICFVLMSGLNYLEMSLMAVVFGYDLSVERQFFGYVSQVVSWSTLLLIMAGLMGLLETFALTCMTIVVALKADRKLSVLDLGLKVGIHPLFAWLFTLLFPIWFMSLAGMLELPAGVKDLFVVLLVVCLVAMIGQGTIVLIQKAVQRGPSARITLITLGAFIPGINLIVAAVGWWSLIRHSSDFKHLKRKKNETI